MSSSQAQQRPELAGVKVKKRKKDLKSRYEPEDFCEALIDEIREAEGNLEIISKKLDAAADPLDFKKYSEPLFDVLIAGAMIDAGSGELPETEQSPFSIFAAEDSVVEIKKHVEVFNLLIRRYRYLQKGFEDSITKVLRLIHRMPASGCHKFAVACSLFFAQQMAPMSLLTVLFMEHLVKDGHALQFITTLFKAYLSEQSIEHLMSSLRKNGIDDRLLEFFPESKRTDEFFSRHFTSEGLKEIAAFYEKRQYLKKKAELGEQLQTMISEPLPFAEVVAFLKQKKTPYPEAEVIPLIWEAIMGSVDWSRKPEQYEEQALKQAKDWSKLFPVVVSNAKTELTLLVSLQNFCYEDSRVTKMFSKFVTLLYKMEVLSEAAILYWNTKGAGQKGKAIFMQQMEPFMKWLKEAEEESDDEK